MNYKKTLPYKLAIVTYLKLINVWWNIIIKWTYKSGIHNSCNKGSICTRLLLRILEKMNVQAMNILSHRDYAKLDKKSNVNIIKEERTGCTIGLVYDIDQVPQSYNVPMGDLYMVNYHNITIHGESDIICNFDKNIVINDYAYELNDQIVSCATNVIKKQYKHCALVKKSAYGADIKEGILLCNTFSSNYYHILYEVLIKFQLLKKLNIPNSIPLIVDKCISHIPQFQEIFNILSDNERDVIYIDEDKYYNVGNAFYLSPINHIPQQLIRQHAVKLTDFAFDKNILVEYKDDLFKYKSQDAFPKRIFISRKGHARRQYNESDLLDVVKKYNFEVIHPEQLSFSQQITLYNNADIIVGATGASFANIMFMKEGAIAVCLMGEDIMFPGFTIGADIAKSHLIYVIGKKKRLHLGRHSFQADFSICPDKLDTILKKAISKIGNNQK